MKLSVLESPVAIAAEVADVVARVATNSAAPAVLLPAGRTPLALYAELRERVARTELELAHVHFFQLDEIAGVRPDDARGFYDFLERELLDPIDHPRPHRHLIDGTAADARAEIELHARALAELGGADLALLGLGKNGHVAFNEPGSELDDPARVVELDEVTRSGLAHEFEPVPTQGLTLGLAEIAAARTVCMIVTGGSKRSVLAELLATPATCKLPATFVHEHPHAIVYADRAAAPEPGVQTPSGPPTREPRS